MPIICLPAVVGVTASPGPAQRGSSKFMSFTTPRLPTTPACLDHMTQMTQNPAEGSEAREAVPSRRRAPGTNKSKEPMSHASQECRLQGAGCSPKLSLHSSHFWGWSAQAPYSVSPSPSALPLLRGGAFSGRGGNSWGGNDTCLLLTHTDRLQICYQTVGLDDCVCACRA